MLRKLVRRTRRIVNIALGKDVDYRIQVARAIERHGNDSGGWFIVPDLLSSRSVVYSVGIGEDISFDISLIERYGAIVHAFDPTPASIAWVKGQAVPSQFRLHEVGIAAHDGSATFFPPDNPRHISHTMIDRVSTRDRAITVEVRRLSSLMRELGHSKVDLLKMDIEGAEYAVLEDILKSEIPITQILVEFHHRFAGLNVAATQRAVESLNEKGYRIFAKSESGEEYSFIQ